MKKTKFFKHFTSLSNLLALGCLNAITLEDRIDYDMAEHPFLPLNEKSMSFAIAENSRLLSPVVISMP